MPLDPTSDTNATREHPAEREPMSKQVIRKEDGRRLIHYRFGPRPAATQEGDSRS